MGLFEWYAELNWKIRFAVALFFIGISTFLYFGADRFWPWGWAVGAILLLFSFPSDSKKKGYHF